jgi:hypothetical protein
MSNTKKTNTEVITQDIMMVIDESGSMESMGLEPIKAVNSFISDQKNIADGSTFTLWKFNSKATKVLDDIPLKDVPEFTDYEPDTMTALNDAICEAVKTKLAHKNNRNVICVILTDGLENASQKYETKDTNKIISTAKNDYNWTFIYLGANQDSFNVGVSMGFYRDNCANFDSCLPGSLYKLTRETSYAVSAHRLASNRSETHGVPVPNMNIRSLSCPGRTTEVMPNILTDELPLIIPSFESKMYRTPRRKLRRSDPIYSGLNKELLDM